MRKLIGRAGEYITSALEKLGYKAPPETNETIVTFAARGVGGEFTSEEKRRLRQLSNLYSLGGVCPENEYQSSKWSESFKSLVEIYMGKNDEDRKKMRDELTGEKKKETDAWRGVDGIFAQLLNRRVRDKKKGAKDLFKKHGLAFPVPSGKSEDDLLKIMKTAVYDKFSTPEGRKLIDDLLVDGDGRMKFWVAEARGRGGKINPWTIQIKDLTKTPVIKPTPVIRPTPSSFKKLSDLRLFDNGEKILITRNLRVLDNPEEYTVTWPKGSILSLQDSLKLEIIKAMITEYKQIKARNPPKSILEEKSDNISEYLSYELTPKLLKACKREIPGLFIPAVKRWSKDQDRGGVRVRYWPKYD